MCAGLASVALTLDMLADKCGRCLDEVLRVWPRRALEWPCGWDEEADELGGGCEMSEVAEELSGRMSVSVAASLREETLPSRFFTAPDLERLCLYVRQLSALSGVPGLSIGSGMRPCVVNGTAGLTVVCRRA